MQHSTHLLSFIFFLFSTQALVSQNYLRVGDPDDWQTPASNEPLWEGAMAHGQFEEVTIIAEPQGIYTEIGFYATISQGPDAWSWQGEYEIIWQFSLPANAIVHDSWLWVEQDIIKADIIDFWTALATYEDIVDRNQDPSFFYQLSDNRYEIRIYPLYEGETRRIKMSFLIPATWNEQSVISDLLQNLLQSTDYPPSTVAIGMPVSELWQSPKIKINNTLITMTDTIVGGSGNLLHYLEVPGSQFVSVNNKVELVIEAPLSDNNSFLSTYSVEGENYYQLAFLPDWESATQPPSKSLILLDYNDFKTSLSKEAFINHLQTTLGTHFTASDNINAVVTTSNGVKFLSDAWWEFDADVFADTLAALLEAQDEIDLEQLLIEGFTWAQNQGDVDHIYLLAANDDFVYPPVADDIFSNLQNLLMTNIPFTLLDYQDENVSIIYYNNEAYHGNEYFYQLLSLAFSESEVVVFRDGNEEYDFVLTSLFPAIEFPTGILDFTTTLEYGIAYHRYSLNSSALNAENKGVILQTGKYLGNFPMHINANLITDDGEFFNLTTTVEPAIILAGDTLMKEMWYGPYLKSLEILASSDEDRLYVIEQSMNERVLTGLTAFLALEPGQGGEPCIGCLLNDGGVLIGVSNEQFDPSKANLVVNPNPVSDLATIQLIYSEALNPQDWTATIFDASGRIIRQLDLPNASNNALEWKWEIGNDIKAGIYFCKIQSDYGELTGKIIVLPN